MSQPSRRKHTRKQPNSGQVKKHDSNSPQANGPGLEGVPIEIVEAVEKQLIARIEQKVHAGPLPAPEDFGKYETFLPGTAERILSMAESEAKHRHEMDEKRLKYFFKENRWGQVLAFLLCLVVVIAGAFVATQQEGGAWPGSILSTTGVVGIITAYLNRTSKSKKQ